MAFLRFVGATNLIRVSFLLLLLDISRTGLVPRHQCKQICELLSTIKIVVIAVLCFRAIGKGYNLFWPENALLIVKTIKKEFPCQTTGTI